MRSEEETNASETHSLSAPLTPTSEVLKALLDMDQLHALFDDYRHCASVQSVRGKSPGERRANEELLSIEDAFQSLRSAPPISFQIRYEHKGAIWSDTLSHTPGGVRLIRYRLPEI